jgi:tRNA-specific 2-thiouridylase
MICVNNKEGSLIVKAIGLLSGGLDSTLAVKLMLEQNIHVLGLNFVTPFCTCTKKGCKNQAMKVRDKYGIGLKIIKLKEEYINLIKNPKHGYGKNMNPCIDCRILMFSAAKKYMNETNASFVFTGEVLGERPMSQHLVAMRVIEKESGLEGRLLRPLCAKFLKPTIPEIDGIIDRNGFLAINGRSRKPQIALAQKLGIDDYPCPAGGCRLTDRNFANRLKEAFKYGEDSIDEIILLKYGRHFRLSSGAKVIVGRNVIENDFLKSHTNQNTSILEVVDFPGPITLLKNFICEEDIKIAAGLCITFSDFKQNKPVKIRIQEKEFLFTRLSKKYIDNLRIK